MYYKYNLLNIHINNTYYTNNIMSASIVSINISTIKPKEKKITVDNFYDNKKEIIDICDNFINKDRYPFIDI